MKSKIEKTRMCSAFTIVELLTVMSIIIILIGILVPGLNQVRRYALFVKQKNQLSAIGKAIEFFNVENQGYPDSGPVDQIGAPYCGAMKLCEAMVGQDFLGFHPDSRFRQDGTDGQMPPKPLYYGRTPNPDPVILRESEKERKKLYLPLETANAYKLGDIYPNTGPFPPDLPVLCDVYNKTYHLRTGRNIGMPILYYKANSSKFGHNETQIGLQNNDNIYNVFDNDQLILLGLPWESQAAQIAHPMASVGMTYDNVQADPKIFYRETINLNVSVPKPYKADSFILMSAGFDGLYGTKDDVFDFEK